MRRATLRPDCRIAGPQASRLPKPCLRPVRFTGPAASGDEVFTASPTMPANNRYIGGHLTHTVSNGLRATLIAPTQPGEHHIRYYSGRNGRSLAYRTVQITPHQVSIEAPASVPPGSQFAVTWSGPNAGGDFLFIAPAGMGVPQRVQAGELELLISRTPYGLHG